ncbi:MAG: hypothetical protein KDH96_04445 [Candidatus Riesia sp.]|nr:hypothetical protein [Candidatus Riesia sp.]
MSIDELVNAVIEKYQNVTELAYDKHDVPTYSHKNSNNGIGCAIGCLIDADRAEEMQNLAESAALYTISELLNYSELSQDLSEYLHTLFGDIDAVDLDKIQFLHDNSNTVEEFLDRCKNYNAIL